MAGRKRTAEEARALTEEVQRLTRAGHDAAAIARLAGIPLSSVYYYRSPGRDRESPEGGQRNREAQPPAWNDHPDRGCEVAPRCLECPLPQCRYDRPGQAERAAALDARTAEVARLTAAGMTDGEIADRLGISRGNVYYDRKRARERGLLPIHGSASREDDIVAELSTVYRPGETARPATIPAPPPIGASRAAASYVDQMREEYAHLVAEVEAVSVKRKRAEQISAALKALGEDAPVPPWRGKPATKADGGA